MVDSVTIRTRSTKEDDDEALSFNEKFKNRFLEYSGYKNEEKIILNWDNLKIKKANTSEEVIKISFDKIEEKLLEHVQKNGPLILGEIEDRLTFFNNNDLKNYIKYNNHDYIAFIEIRERFNNWYLNNIDISEIDWRKKIVEYEKVKTLKKVIFFLNNIESECSFKKVSIKVCNLINEKIINLLKKDHYIDENQINIDEKKEKKIICNKESYLNKKRLRTTLLGEYDNILNIFNDNFEEFKPKQTPTIINIEEEDSIENDNNDILTSSKFKNNYLQITLNSEISEKMIIFPKEYYYQFKNELPISLYGIDLWYRIINNVKKIYTHQNGLYNIFVRNKPIFKIEKDNNKQPIIYKGEYLLNYNLPQIIWIYENNRRINTYESKKLFNTITKDNFDAIWYIYNEKYLKKISEKKLLKHIKEMEIWIQLMENEILKNKEEKFKKYKKTPKKYKTKKCFKCNLSVVNLTHHLSNFCEKKKNIECKFCHKKNIPASLFKSRHALICTNSSIRKLCIKCKKFHYRFGIHRCNTKSNYHLCVKCNDRSFKKIEQLNKHLIKCKKDKKIRVNSKGETKWEYKSIKCPFPDCNAEIKVKLKRHIINNHIKKGETIPDIDKYLKNEETIECPRCLETPIRKYIKNHLRSKTCKSFADVISDDQVEDIIKFNKDPSKLQCFNCNKFPLKEFFEIHLKKCLKK
jgi:hypothetical protein